MALIEARGLEKYYRIGGERIAALQQVDLSLDAGVFAVVAGRSGSGKTTLLNMIGALDMPDAGRISIDGVDVLALSGGERAAFRLRHIGFVFQAYNLIRTLSARENVAYVLQLQGMEQGARDQLADRWLREVGLEGLGDRRPDALSGGQQQRVAVARALASRPDIVLADEPTANLDSHTGEALIGLMRRLNREHGVTFLIASHDPMVIAAAATLIRMEDGAIVSVSS